MKKQVAILQKEKEEKTNEEIQGIKDLESKIDTLNREKVEQTNIDEQKINGLENKIAQLNISNEKRKQYSSELKRLKEQYTNSKEEDKKKLKMQTGKKNKWNLKKNMKDLLG